MSLMVFVALIVVAVGAGLVFGSMASRRLGPGREEQTSASAKASSPTPRQWVTRAAVRAWKRRNKRADKRR